MTLWNWFLKLLVATVVLKSYADYVLICNLLGIRHQCSLQSNIWAFGRSDWKNLWQDQFGDLHLSFSPYLDSDKLCIIMHACFATQTFTWSEHELQSRHSEEESLHMTPSTPLHFLKCYSIHSTMQMCSNDNEWNHINIYSLSEFWPVHSATIYFISQ
jgi:hypothetical protein